MLRQIESSQRNRVAMTRHIQRETRNHNVQLFPTFSDCEYRRRHKSEFLETALAPGNNLYIRPTRRIKEIPICHVIDTLVSMIVTALMS